MMPGVRPICADDYEIVSRWIAQPEINRWLYAEWRQSGVDEKLVALAAMNRRNRFFMVDSADNRPVGVVAISQIVEHDRHCSIWYLLGDHGCAGQGVMGAAVGLVMKIAFADLGIHTIEASVMAGNHASIRVLEKNGFEYVGTMRDGFLFEDRFVDRMLFNAVGDA
jgi:[ribosomal protein S5]-alanine N-acetyltransferase